MTLLPVTCNIPPEKHKSVAGTVVGTPESVHQWKSFRTIDQLDGLTLTITSCFTFYLLLQLPIFFNPFSATLELYRYVITVKQYLILLTCVFLKAYTWIDYIFESEKVIIFCMPIKTSLFYRCGSPSEDP